MIRVNLIPAFTQLGLLRRRRLKAWAVSNGVLAVLLVVPLGLEWVNRARAEGLRAEHLQVQKRLAEARAALRSVRGEAEGLLLQIQRADALRSKRAWSGMLALIGRSMPPSCWLTQLATDPPAPQGSGAVRSRITSAERGKGDESEVVTIDAPRKLRLTGYAADAADPLTLVTNLKSSGVFADVVLQRSQLERGASRQLFTFEVVCEW